MTGAKVLAIAGLTSSIAVMLGGWLGRADLVGAAGAIMIAGNILAIAVESPKIEQVVETFARYSDIARQSDVYPKIDRSDGRLPVYPALALSGEAGEFSEKVKKAWRDGTPLDRVAALNELGDVLWYVDAAAKDLGYTLADAASANLVKITSRRARGKLAGSGDSR